MSTPALQRSSDDLLALEPVIRRVVGSRVADPHAAEDLVQETFSRVLGALPRLDGEALAPYAIVTARNLVTTAGRDASRWRRHEHRLVDLREPERPEEDVLRSEERLALKSALSGLTDAERLAIVSHEVEGADTGALADALGTTPGAVAVRLARVRAKLRVDYLVAFRAAELPTARCRPVLLALSAGDRRRQRALGAGAHLLECETCSSLSTPLLERRRSAAAFFPPLGLTGALTGLWRWVKTSTGSAVAALAALAVVAALVATSTFAAHRTAATASATARRTSVVKAPAESSSWLRVGGRPVAVRSAAAALAPLSGREVEVTAARVVSVPADEGFFVGTDAGHVVWVQLQGSGESPFQVRPGETISSSGRVVANPPHFAELTGVTAAEGAGALTSAGYHIEVADTAVRIG